MQNLIHIEKTFIYKLILFLCSIEGLHLRLLRIYGKIKMGAKTVTNNKTVWQNRIFIIY